MTVFDAARVEFRATAAGGLCFVDGDGNVHEHVYCLSLFPLSDPEGYVSVLRGHEKEDEEIGVIRDLRELPRHERELVLQSIRQHHFLPEIEDITQITDFHGVEEWKVVTDRGPKTFYVGGERRNSIIVDDANMVLVTDVDKCRYRVPDIQALQPKARSLLERALP